jgi:O-antigen/teichoic acid export membrane protein
MRIGSALFTGGLTLFLLRYLGPDDYGVYALALSVSGLIALPIDFGVSRSAARFIAERRDDAHAVSAVLRNAVVLKAIASGIGALLLIVLADPIASAYGAGSLAGALRLVSIAVVGQTFMFLFTTTCEALGRNSIGFGIAVSESALEAVLSVTLVLTGAGVTGAIAGRAVGYSVAAIAGGIAVARLLGRGYLSGPSHPEVDVRRIARFATALFVIDAAFGAFGYVDILLIGAMLDPRSSALFSAPAQILTFAQYAGLALAAGIGPRLGAGIRKASDLDAFRLGLRGLIVVQFLCIAPMVVWATPITNLLFGSGYQESADVLRALTPYAVMLGPTPMLALCINYLGAAMSRIPLAIGAVVINAVVDVILIPQIGVVAGAIGTDVAFLFFTMGHLRIARSLIDLPLRPLGLTVMRTLAAAAAMSAVLFAVGTSHLTVIEAVAGAVLGTLAYGLVLLVVREVSISDLRAASGAARALAR